MFTEGTNNGCANMSPSTLLENSLPKLATFTFDGRSRFSCTFAFVRKLSTWEVNTCPEAEAQTPRATLSTANLHRGIPISHLFPHAFTDQSILRCLAARQFEEPTWLLAARKRICKQKSTATHLQAPAFQKPVDPKIAAALVHG